MRIKGDMNKQYLVCSRSVIHLPALPPFSRLESISFVSFPQLSSELGHNIAFALIKIVRDGKRMYSKEVD